MTEPSLQSLAEDASSGDCRGTPVTAREDLRVSRTTLDMRKGLRSQVEEVFTGYTQDKSCLKKSESHDGWQPIKYV